MLKRLLKANNVSTSGETEPYLGNLKIWRHISIIFAHILDMFDGREDGTPLLNYREQYRAWAEVCTRVFYDLRQKMEKGRKTFLNAYAATNEAESFAVATEYFFD